MGTRCVFTFKDARESHHVYMHWDGYPSGAAEAIQNTLESGKVWPLPRFEADEFAAGFVAANKVEDGNFRLMRSRTSAADIEYAYTIDVSGEGVLHIKAESVDNWDGWKAKTLFKGRFDEFKMWAASRE